MAIVKLLGTRKDKAKAFYWMITNMNTYSCEKDEFMLRDEDFKRFKRVAFLRRFKYEVVK